MRLAPCTIKAAKAWVSKTHRHLPEFNGARFAVAVVDDAGVMHGVAVASNGPQVWEGTGRLNIGRVSTDGTPDVCSMLYGAICRAGKALGYLEAWTYTLPEEPGTSLRAAGFVDMGVTEGGEHDREGRPRKPAKQAGPKRRWRRVLSGTSPTQEVAMVAPENLALVQGDALEVLRGFADNTFRCCVTSPPYYALRDYGVEGQLGQEETPEAFVERLVEILGEVKRVLTEDGSLYLNLGDSYAGSGNGGGGTYAAERRGWDPSKTGFRMPTVGYKMKDLIGVPWLAAFALRAAGWYLRQDIIWHKPNPLPESVEDRFTKSHEHVFLLSKSEKYHFDFEAVKEEAIGQNAHDVTGGGYSPPGQSASLGDRRSWNGSTFDTGKTAKHQGKKPRKNENSDDHRILGFQDRWNAGEKPEMRRKRDVWSIAVGKYKGAHFAVMPEKLVEPCVLAGSAPGDIVLDPFCGSGTVGVVALQHGRRFVGVDLNPEYLQLAAERIGSKEKAA